MIEPDQYEALCACKTYDAVATDIDDVWFVNTTFEPFTAKDPVILTDPVNWCVFANSDPLIEEPVT